MERLVEKEGSMTSVKKTILAAVLLAGVPMASHAELVPSGCYVTDSERIAIGTAFGYTPTCYRAGDNYYNWYTHDQVDRTQLSVIYGPFVEALMYSGYKEAVDCNGAYNTLVSNFNSLLSDYKAGNAREKKLRKACGSKCKRIK